MKKWTASRAPAGRIAYVNGRYLPHGAAGVHIEDRALQLGDGIYEVAAISGGKMIDRKNISTGWSGPCARSAWTCRWRARR